MKLIFFGTSAFAAYVLNDLLLSHHEIIAVVTKPDTPQGRSRKLTPPPVKQMLLDKESEIPLFQPEKASTAEFAETLRSFHPDLFVVVAYGEILKENILSVPKKASINIHTSLLPKYRGAAPIRRALMAGENESGVTIIEMALKMDAGKMLAQEKISIDDEMNFGELAQKMQVSACSLVKHVIKDYSKGTISGEEQNLELVSFAPKLKPEEFEIDWHQSAGTIHNLIRALSPKPGAWCFVNIQGSKKRMKILHSKIYSRKQGSPKSIEIIDKSRLIVFCEFQALELLEIQLEGKKPLSAKNFLQGLNNPFTVI